MSKAGDALQLAEQTAILVRAGCFLGKLEVSKQAAEAAISLLSDFCLVSVDRNKLLLPPPPTKPLASAASTHTLGSGTSATTSGAVLVPQKVESSRENVIGLVEVTFSFVDCLLWEMTSYLPAEGVVDTGHFDPRASYMTLCDRLSRVFDTVCDVCGTISELSAKVLAKRASAGAAALLLMHALSGACAGLPPQAETYRAWFADNLLMCVEYMERVVQMRKMLLSFLTIKDTLYFKPLGSETAATPVGDETDPSSSSSSPPPYVELSLIKTRELAMSEIELARLETFLVLLKGEHISDGSSYAERSALSVVEQYLEKTRPQSEVGLATFSPPGSFRSSAVLGGAAQSLRGTSHSLEAQTLFQVHNCMILRRSGAYDACWNPSLRPTGGGHHHHRHHGEREGEKEGEKEKERERLSLHPTAERCREILSSLTRQLLEQGKWSSSHSNASFACVALAEAFGPNRPAKAACWILQLQSLVTRSWLKGLWLRSLPATSAVAAALRRIDALEEAQGGALWPSSNAMKQIEAEKLFLSTTSVAYKRLAVSTDPAVAVQAAPSAVAFFCLQFCPLGESLYICAGKPSEASKAHVGTAPPAKGAPPPAAGAGSLPPPLVADMVDSNWFFEKVIYLRFVSFLYHTLHHHKYFVDYLFIITPYLSIYLLLSS